MPQIPDWYYGSGHGSVSPRGGTLVVDVTPKLKTILVDQQPTPLSPDKTVRLSLGSRLVEIQAELLERDTKKQM